MHADARMPLVSVIIPVKNGASTIGAQLDALANQASAPLFEIIVSDNGSTDDLPNVLAAAKCRWPHLDIRRIESSKKRGINFARNEGVRFARGRLILFCDSDDIVGADWVRELAKGLDTYDGVGGVIEERTLNPPNSPLQAWTSTSLPVALGFLPFPIGANCGVRREVWLALNGFDEEYLHGSDDVDFYWRLQLAGYTLGFVPDAVVAYRHRRRALDNFRVAFQRGIGSCQLAARFRAQIPPELPVIILWRWARLVGSMPLLVTPGRRLGYLRGAAHRFGQVVGSLRYRVIHLT